MFLVVFSLLQVVLLRATAGECPVVPTPIRDINSYASSCPWQLRSEVVMCVWSAAPISGRDEWKYSLLDHGALSLTLTGPVKMHRLSVAQWDTSDLVRFTAAISCASILQEKL